MSFAAPLLLVLLALAPLSAAALAVVRRWQTRAAARYAGRRLTDGLVPLASRGRWALRATLLVAAVALIVLAAARPQFGSQQTEVEKTGIDLMLALDVSQSMNARDVQPSRLSHAQEEILSLLERLRGDRAGLVIFARSAVLRSPLSTDLRAVAELVKGAHLDEKLLEPGTTLAAAVEAATDALAEGPPVAIDGPPADRTRAMLLVSDGEDHGSAAAAAARGAAEQGVRIYTAGVGGREGATIPEAQPGGESAPKLDPATGQPILSRLNETLLRQLAEIGDGHYVALEGSGRPLVSLADDFSGLEKSVSATSRESRPIERFQWFLLAALIALAFEGTVTALRRWPQLRQVRGLPLASLALLGLLGAACAASVNSLNDDGNRLYADGSYAEALEAYQRAQAERPDLGELGYNAANALHRLGRFDRAAEEARRALRTADGPLAARLHYGLGNHLVRDGRLLDAFDSYREALIADPSDTEAKYNLEVVLRLLQDRPPLSEGGGDQQGTPGPPPSEPGPGGPGQATDSDLEPGGGEPEGESEDVRSERIQRGLREALAGIEQEFTIEEALRVLDLLRERQLLQPLVGEPAPVQGPDY